MHLTVEEGLKLKIAMKGGLGGSESGFEGKIKDDLGGKVKDDLGKSKRGSGGKSESGFGGKVKGHLGEKSVSIDRGTFHPRSPFCRQQLSPPL